ncbi:MAG: NUDIX hydrolase [Oscillospiraceae bacterium]
MEYFDIRNPDGSVTGRIKERSLVHRDGDLHGSVHIFIIRDNRDGTHDVLLQRRSYHKDSYPGQLDTSCAGHLSAGDDYITGAIRECREELGLSIKESDLRLILEFRLDSDTEFYGKPFRNHEFVKVYRLMKPVEMEDLKFQKEEIEELEWMDIRDVFEKIYSNTGEICIYPPEADMLYHLFYPSDQRHIARKDAIHS